MVKGVVAAVLAALLIAGWIVRDSEPSAPVATATAPAPTTPAAVPAPPKAAPAPPPKPRIDKSADAQRKRKDLIQKLLNERVFIKVETPGTAPRVHVGPRFRALDFDTKQSFVSVVYAYHYDGVDLYDVVRVFDGQTNKPMGNFTLATGLKLD